MKNKALFLLLLAYSIGSVLQINATRKANENFILTIPANLYTYIPKQINLDKLKASYKKQSYSSPTTQQWQEMFNVISNLLALFENPEFKNQEQDEFLIRLRNQILAREIVNACPKQENKNMLLFLVDYFKIECLKKPLHFVIIPANIYKYAEPLNAPNVSADPETKEVHYENIRITTYDPEILQNAYQKDKVDWQETHKQWQEMFNVISNLLALFENPEFNSQEQETLTIYLKNENLANEISKACSNQKTLKMLLFLVDYFNIQCLKVPLCLKLAKDLHNSKNVALVEQLNKVQKKEILLSYYLLYQQECKHNFGYELDHTDLYENLTPSYLVEKGILPTIENHSQVFTSAEAYAKHPQLHLFFDNIPYCKFKCQLVQDIYNYAQSILTKNNKQEIFNNLPEGILKVTLRLIVQNDQLQLNTDVINLTKVNKRIFESKNSKTLYLQQISSFVNLDKNQCHFTYKKLIHYILLLLPHLNPNLETLELSDDRLKTFPKEIIQLRSLKSLSLCKNELKTLPKEIEALENLQTLELSDNQLQTLPPQIGKLINLKRLFLWKNELKTLPKEIEGLKNLQELYLSKNKLKTLPKEIEALKNLQKLDLSKNELKTLPKEIEALKNLQELDLSKNKFKTLPKELIMLLTRKSPPGKRE